MTAIPSSLALLNLYPDPVWLIDRDKRIIGWNLAAGQVYGPTPDEAMGQTISLFVPHRELGTLGQAVEAVRQNGSWSGELITMTSLGDEVITDARWVAIGTPGEPAEYIMAVFTDVTEQRRRADKEARAGRWAAARKVAAAVVSQGKVGDSPVQLRLFAHGSDPIAEAPECCGTGEGVLVVSDSPIFREMVSAMLDGANYQPLVATDAYGAARLLRSSTERVRSVVLALGSDNPRAAADLRRIRPMLPVVAVGIPATSSTWVGEDPVTVPNPAEPAELLRATAEAVAADRMMEMSLEQ